MNPIIFNFYNYVCVFWKLVCARRILLYANFKHQALRETCLRLLNMLFQAPKISITSVIISGYSRNWFFSVVDYFIQLWNPTLFYSLHCNSSRRNTFNSTPKSKDPFRPLKFLKTLPTDISPLYAFCSDFLPGIKT